MLSPTPEDDVLNSEGTVAGNAGMYVEKYKSQLLLGQINNIVTNYIYPSGKNVDIKYEYAHATDTNTDGSIK